MFKKWNKTPKFQTFFWKIKRELTTLSWELHTCFKESKDQNLNYLKKEKKTKFQQQQIVMILKDIFKSNTKLVSRHHQHHHHINYN